MENEKYQVLQNYLTQLELITTKLCAENPCILSQLEFGTIASRAISVLQLQLHNFHARCVKHDNQKEANDCVKVGSFACCQSYLTSAGWNLFKPSLCPMCFKRAKENATKKNSKDSASEKEPKKKRKLEERIVISEDMANQIEKHVSGYTDNQIFDLNGNNTDTYQVQVNPTTTAEVQTFVDSVVVSGPNNVSPDLPAKEPEPKEPLSKEDDAFINSVIQEILDSDEEFSIEEMPDKPIVDEKKTKRNRSFTKRTKYKLKFFLDQKILSNGDELFIDIPSSRVVHKLRIIEGLICYNREGKDVFTKEFTDIPFYNSAYERWRYTFLTKSGSSLESLLSQWKTQRRIE